MHYSALVLIEPGSDAATEVARLMAPYNENGPDDNPQGKWDWWVIGGRWSSILDREYDATKDPRNFEVCWLCHGSGKRPDMEVANGCNACGGTGKTLKHPPKWAPCPADVKPVTEIDVEWAPFTLLTPDGTWYERTSFVYDYEAESGELVENFTQDEWRRFVPKTLSEHRDKVAVVVDYHS